MPQTLFLSYRHAPSADLARYLRDRLVSLGIDVFFDAESLNAGRFAAIIEKEIIIREHFLVILTPTTLESEWVRREIQTALKHRRNIIPVTAQGFDLSAPPQPFPDEIKELADYSGISYDYQHPEYAIEHIKKALGIDGQRRNWLSILWGIGGRPTVIGWVAILTLLVAFSGVTFSSLTSRTGPILTTQPIVAASQPPTTAPTLAEPNTFTPFPSQISASLAPQPASNTPGTDKEITVSLIRNKDSLIFDVATGTAKISLQTITFDLVGRPSVFFKQFANNFGLNLTSVKIPICLRMLRQGASAPYPQDCQALQPNQRISVEVPDADVFWYDFENSRNVAMTMHAISSDEGVLCAPQQASCLFFVPIASK